MAQYKPNIKRRYLSQSGPLMGQGEVKAARYLMAGAVTQLRGIIRRVEEAAAKSHMPPPAVGHLRTAVMHINQALKELPALRERDNRRTT